MCPTITAITTYVLQQLDVRRFWTVRSVYKKTVNIQAGELLLALQAASSPMSPISILTDMEVRDFEALPVKPGQQVSISRDRIHISSLETPVTFLLRPKEVQSTRLTSPPAQFPWGRLLSQVRQAITGSQAGIFRLLFCDFTDPQAVKTGGEYSLILQRHKIISANAVYVWNRACTGGCLPKPGRTDRTGDRPYARK